MNMHYILITVAWWRHMAPAILIDIGLGNDILPIRPLNSSNSVEGIVN